MSWREFAVEVLKVLLGAPTVTGIVVLTIIVVFRSDIRRLVQRLATLRFPGGELTISQAEVIVREEAKEPTALPGSTQEPPALPAGITITPEAQGLINDFLKAERARAALWEYRYLNLFLVPRTQIVLDWLAALRDRTTIQMYDAYWAPAIPQQAERAAVLSALEEHNLIRYQGLIIEITPKGHEYIQWRGVREESAD